jgi:pheromone shutdown protein TraB
MSGEAVDDAEAGDTDAAPDADAGGLDIDVDPAPEATGSADRPGPVMAFAPSGDGDTAAGADADTAGSVRVVGTAHVSAESVGEVERVVAAECPDVVAVELDEDRFRRLRGETPDDLEAGDLLEGDTVFQFLAYWMLAYVQTQLGDRFDVDPGAEMRAAIEAAPGAGAGVALVDRDIQVTIQRFWRRMTAVEKLRTLSALVFGVVSPPAVAATTAAVTGLVLGPLLAVSTFLLGVPDGTMARLVTGGLAGTLVGSGAGRLPFAPTPSETAADDRRDDPAEDEEPTADAGSQTPSDAVEDGDAPVFREERESETRESGGLRSWLPATAAVVVCAGVAVSGVGSAAVAGTLSSVFVYLLGGMTLGAGAGLVVGVILATAGEDARSSGLEGDHLDVDDLTDADVVTALIAEFREFSPGGASALIDERDAYIAHNLVWLRERGYDVVAVVGAGHREGVERYLADPERLPAFDGLVGRERGRRFSPYRLLGYLITVGFLAVFGLLVLGGADDALLLRLFSAWFLFNGVFAFTMAKLAGARWPSASAGGLMAWFTSVNPLLAPGWIAGYVELRYTTVNVADIDRLNEIVDDESLSPGELVTELLDVPLFRLIAVVGMTNVGSVVATLLFPLVVLPLVAPDGGTAAIGDLILRGIRNGLDVLAGVVS